DRRAEIGNGQPEAVPKSPLVPEQKQDKQREGIGHLLERQSRQKSQKRQCQVQRSPMTQIVQKQPEGSDITEGAPDVAAILPDGEGLSRIAQFQESRNM